MNDSYKSLIQSSTTYTLKPLAESLASTTISNLRGFFYTQTHHRPSDDMWDALADVALIMEQMAKGSCDSEYYLSSLDPGVGKTRIVIEFINTLIADKSYKDVGVIICVSRLDEIAGLVDSIGLPSELFVVMTSDSELNQLGSQNPGSSQILFTTQQMVERRCEGKNFKDASQFHFNGSPRQVRIWDEAILPGQTITLNRDEIAFLFQPLRGAYPELAEGIESLFSDLKLVPDGDQFTVPDFEQEYGVDLNQVLALTVRASTAQQDIASSLWFLSGKVATVRRDGPFGNTCLDYKDTLPNDLERWPP